MFPPFRVLPLTVLKFGTCSRVCRSSHYLESFPLPHSGSSPLRSGELPLPMAPCVPDPSVAVFPCLAQLRAVALLHVEDLIVHQVIPNFKLHWPG